jgi:hypothetical protein
VTIRVASLPAFAAVGHVAGSIRFAPIGGIAIAIRRARRATGRGRAAGIDSSIGGAGVVLGAGIGQRRR